METEARNNPVRFLFENRLSEKLFSKTLFGIVIYFLAKTSVSRQCKHLCLVFSWKWLFSTKKNPQKQVLNCINQWSFLRCSSKLILRTEPRIEYIWFSAFILWKTLAELYLENSLFLLLNTHTHTHTNQNDKKAITNKAGNFANLSWSN